MSYLHKCNCGNEFEVSHEEDICHCEMCSEPSCNECSHVCENPNHTVDDTGCEKCMFYDKQLQMWFCSEDCRQEVIDPYGYLKVAKENIKNAGLAIFESVKALEEAALTGNGGKIAEAKAMLETAATLYLKE